MDLLEVKNLILETHIIRFDKVEVFDSIEEITYPNYSKYKVRFTDELKNTLNPEILFEIVEKDEWEMPVDLMFLVYQRLIELHPQKDVLLTFANYLGFVGGPDWEEEVDSIKKFVNEDKISKAVEVALKVDYYKYQSENIL